jgi:hypothetical protein
MDSFIYVVHFQLFVEAAANEPECMSVCVAYYETVWSKLSLLSESEPIGTRNAFQDNLKTCPK